ncbi:hypothetical protein Dsin_024356 [Dipteronia sinensis]|uniref:Uncharacterized protein n=1 Tax=Dipteronia sinensis TaxID=43782 RepID=A0AAD9ZU24_9ROSI|nr:hypothetical protein Dsin_024356 [Dipteronia sinensis]
MSDGDGATTIGREATPPRATPSPRSLSVGLHHPPPPLMEARWRSASKQSQLHSNEVIHSSTAAATPTKASNMLPLPLYITNAVFFTAVCYLLSRWREKIRNSTPLHMVS